MLYQVWGIILFAQKGEEMGDHEFWFIVGSQDLYGEECLRNVAEHAQIIVEKLNASGKLPFEVVWKPTLS